MLPPRFVDFMLMFLLWLSHRYPLLWRLHVVHHGVGRLCGLNGLVRHPLCINQWI